MYFVKAFLALLVISTASCGGMMDDLSPSGDDKRGTFESDTTGASPGQTAPLFTISDIYGSSFNLTEELAKHKAVVMYFTMWCPICDSHTAHQKRYVLPEFPGVRFCLVDYVSGSVVDSNSAAIASGYANAGFTVLSDTDQTVLNLYNATMGTTVVIDSSGVVRMNEDYKDGGRLQEILRSLQ